MRPYRHPSDAGRPRLAPLAVLPVFLDLTGRRCVVAGGSAAAAWKAELLAAAGAEVHIFAPDPAAGMRDLVLRGASAGSLHLHGRAWRGADFAATALAIATADVDGGAEIFAEAARAAGVPVNIVDRPALGDVRFGAIVNRSPVVVGISTGGAAPILAQAIRRRIEMLLPTSLADWAAAARRARERLGRIMPDAGTRRRFWERFAETALTRRPGRDPEARLIADATSLSCLSRDPSDRRETGSVTLVGAGPGDAELLTVKAIRAMQAADVILFDDLVSPEILDFARREARRTLVGKRGRRPSCRQDDINAMMVGLARQGKKVVRLKGGDPTIFGRAGEEIAWLDAAGIPVDIVPGITAASGAAARLRVSLTHREHAHSVRYVTAHARNGRLPDDIDWTGLADPGTSLILYMAGRTGPDAARRLLQEGLDPATPVVAIAAATRPDERIWAGGLAELSAGLPNGLPRTPLLVCIGRAFAAPARGAVRLPHHVQQDAFIEGDVQEMGGDIEEAAARRRG